ncbi:MAG: hydantoinase B/oxoprolinase family protein [Promethearchaeota archaeon]|nr:MAG: hydantoinase B/oxoprolinase family protein [Candidatus Lokiarchaeota archaeon]
MKSNKIDPITAEVINNSFHTIAEEMGTALIRSAYSTNIKERRDCSTGIFDRQGNLIALAEHIPIHLGSMQGLMTEIVYDLDSWNFKPGDIVIANDPYHGGGSHLPDVTLIHPVFYDTELVAFVTNIAHWSDVGGRYPGIGTAGDSTEITQEGLRISPIRIVSQGKIQNRVLELLLINMRCREERYGDFRSQLASLLLGERRIEDLFSRYGKDTIFKSVSENLNHSERILRKRLLQIPEGDYSSIDFMDDDGISNETLKICVKITVNHGYKPSIGLDFSKTASQTAGGINMVKAALKATVFYAIKAICAPEVPFNSGFQRPIKIYAQRGSLLNAEEPAAVGGRTDTCQRVVDLIMRALARAVPEKVVAGSNGATTAIIFGGTKQLSDRDFVYIEALGGGMGARAMKDGMDGVQVHITNTSNLPIEAMELEYPLRILRFGLVIDSGGPGKFRGGMGIQKDIKILKSLIFSAHSDRHQIKPWGLENGLPGASGKFVLNPNTDSEKIIPSKTSGVIMSENDVLRVTTAGGGGFGSPLERDPVKVKNDLILEKISPRQVKEIYGVVINSEGEIDFKATKTLRDNIKEAKH